MSYRFDTRAIHAYSPETDVESQSISLPIHQTASFAFENMEDLDRVASGQAQGYGYSRVQNPTNAALERAIALLGGGEEAVSFASGMAALSAAVISQVQAQDLILAPLTVYGGTQMLLSQVLSKLAVTTSFVDFRDMSQVEAALQERPKLVMAETLVNPTAEVTELGELAQKAHRVGAKLVVDSTLATPVLARPLELGADLVVHSATKYLGGHGDLLSGLVVGSKAVMRSVRHTAMTLGGNASPFESWLVLRGLKTLSLRMDRHGQSALRVARFLQNHSRVQRVWYPGQPENPGYARAQTLMPRGQGGLLSFELEGDQNQAIQVLNRLHLFLRAGSLGDAHSLAVLPSMTSHRSLSPQERKAAGLTEGFIRLSVGLEDPEDLIKDLAQALDSKP